MTLATRIIKALGGYTEDEVLTTAVKHLYNTIGEEDILKGRKDGHWTMNGKVLDEATKQLLIGEAKTFLHTRLWKVLRSDIKYRANLLMFERSKTEQDLIAGKLWLYTLDSINTRLESLSEGRGTFNSDAQ